MTIRITTISEPNRTVLKVDGRLQQDDIDELLRAIQGLEGPKALDLAELRMVDRAAVAVLRDILRLGVELNATPPYVKFLLEMEPARKRSTDTADD